MPNAAVVAAALTDHSTRRYGLFLGGVDVAKQPGATANGYGVPIDTVEVTEASPGQVSSMTFTLIDPQNAISLAAGMTAVLVDFTHDVPDFYGFVDTAELSPIAISRTISVTCVGIEIVLDWMVLGADLTVASATPGDTAAQMIISACPGIGVALNASSSGGAGGSYDNPIGISSGATTSYALALTAGTTLRQALQALGDAIIPPFNAVSTCQMLPATVDFYGGVWFNLTGTDVAGAGARNTVWFSNLGVGVRINVSSAGPKIPADPKYTPLSGAGVRQVYVKGGNAAGTLTVNDGSGQPGQTAVLSDTNILTASDAVAKGTVYMAQNGTGASGSFRLEGTTQASGRDAGFKVFGGLVYTDPLLGLSSAPFLMSSITKRFYANGTEDWDIAFGARWLMGAQRIRSLTNSVIR